MPKVRKSNTKADALKPDLPAFDPIIPKDRKRYPLFCHASGRWAKKIRGDFVYFGYWRGPDAIDPKEAAARFHEQRQDLEAGRKPRTSADPQVMTVARLVNLFLGAKLSKVDAREMSLHTFKDYQRCCKQFVEHFGRSRLAEDMKPEDFVVYRAKLAAKYSPTPLGREIQMVRTMYKWAHESGYLTLPRFGPDFKRPKPATLKADRNSKPVKFIENDQLRQLIEMAKYPMKAMILLGINAGLGDSDIANLRMQHMDLELGWLCYPRMKTATSRRVPLWERTIQALKTAISVRPTPTNPDDADRVFITRDGNPYLRTIRDRKTDEATGKTIIRICPINSLAQQFGRLMRIATFARKGVGFYALRHTFRSIGGQLGDKAAVDMMMGHGDPSDMGESVYNHMELPSVSKPYDPRLRKVVAHVEDWLFGNEDMDSRGKGDGPQLKLVG